MTHGPMLYMNQSQLDELLDAARQQGYAAVLRDAVEAVKALEPRLRIEKFDGGYDCCGCSTTFYLFDDAVAAIEALSGER